MADNNQIVLQWISADIETAQDEIANTLAKAGTKLQVNNLTDFTSEKQILKSTTKKHSKQIKIPQKLKY